MPYDLNLHHRRSIRLHGYDYRQAGAYFVTICANQRACLFGHIVDDAGTLNAAGLVVQDVWHRLPERFPMIELDAFVVMPNHVHGIIVIVACEFDPRIRIGDVVGAFKSITTRGYIAGVRQHHWHPFDGQLWQRNYYEPTIRDDPGLNRVREYIANNPLQWTSDPEYSDT